MGVICSVCIIRQSRLYTVSPVCIPSAQPVYCPPSLYTVSPVCTPVCIPSVESVYGQSSLYAVSPVCIQSVQSVYCQSSLYTVSPVCIPSFHSVYCQSSLYTVSRVYIRSVHSVYHLSTTVQPIYSQYDASVNVTLGQMFAGLDRSFRKYVVLCLKSNCCPVILRKFGT